MTNAERNIEAALGRYAGRDLIGWLAWWDLAGEAPRDAVERAVDAAAAAGVPATWMPARQGSERRLRKAGEAICRRAGRKWVRAGRVGDVVTFRVVTLGRCDDATAAAAEYVPDVDVETSPAVALDVPTGLVTLQDPNDELTLAISAEFARRASTFDTDDQRALLLRAFEDLRAIVLRDAGGMYYVPRTARAETALPALRAILSNVAGTRLYVPPLPNVEAWAEPARDAASNDLNKCAATLLSDLEGFAERAISGDLVRDASLRERVKDAREIGERAALYADVLALKVDEVKNLADAARKIVRDVVEAAGEIRAAEKAGEDVSVETRRLGAELRAKVAGLRSTKPAVASAEGDHPFADAAA